MLGADDQSFWKGVRLGEHARRDQRHGEGGQGMHPGGRQPAPRDKVTHIGRHVRNAEDQRSQHQ